MGKITEIRSGKQGKRVNIFIDGRFALALDAAIAIQEKLRTDTELDSNRIKELVKIDEIHRGLDTATRYLGYRPRSEMELRNQLQRRGFTAEIIDSVINKLKEQGLVDDISFARFWTENRESFSPRSQYLTACELKQKGINGEIIARSVSNIDDGDSAYRIALIKARRLNKIDFPDFRKRLGGYLQRRGFSYEIINQTLAKIWQEKTEGNFPDPVTKGGDSK